jgi:hypothetical protein
LGHPHFVEHQPLERRRVLVVLGVGEHLGIAAWPVLGEQHGDVHHPEVFARIDTARFGLTRPEDLLQGAVTPVLREDYTILPNGRVVIVLGDAHSVVDPVVGQGANSASYSA